MVFVESRLQPDFECHLSNVISSLPLFSLFLISETMLQPDFSQFVEYTLFSPFFCLYLIGDDVVSLFTRYNRSHGYSKLVLLKLAMKMQLKFKCELSSVGEMNRVVISRKHFARYQSMRAQHLQWEHDRSDIFHYSSATHTHTCNKYTCAHT